MTDALVPVLDVGGTHVTAALVDLTTLRPAAVATRPLDAAGPADAIVETFGDAAAELRAGAGRRWGIAMPGPFDYPAGAGTFAGVDKFGALAGVPLRPLLGVALDTAPDRIRFLNDADAYALGEWDAQQRPDRLMCVTLGTGVGGGFVEEGRVLTDDPRVPAGGDLYHLTWQGAPLEDHVSRRALLRAFGEPGLDVKDIAHRARTGDDAARRLMERSMGVLAEVLAPWADSFRPDVLVVGGSIARSWDVIGPAFTAAIERLASSMPSVRPTSLHDAAPLIGAAEFARDDRSTLERNRT